MYILESVRSGKCFSGKCFSGKCFSGRYKNTKINCIVALTKITTTKQLMENICEIEEINAMILQRKQKRDIIKDQLSAQLLTF